MHSRLARLAATALLGLALLPGAAGAQGTGRIVGRVIDAASGRGIAGAQISVGGSALRTTAGVDGRYALTGVPAGSRNLMASFLGYAPKTVTGVAVAGDGAVNVDITLSVAAIGVEGITVTAVRERGSVNRALDEQRTATGVVNAITAEQIARSPDADAAQAVQRVSGVTVSEGKFVVVRGMAERYTTTSLNGARIPSPEPERKLVPLDLFPTGIVQQVTTSKSFTPDLPGDFAGAHVNIRTREYPTRRSFVLSSSVGFNDAVTGRDAAFAPRAGGELFAWTGVRRQLPDPLRAGGDLSANFTQDQQNRFVNSFRNAWTPRTAQGAPNSSLSASLGGSDLIFGQRLGYLFSGSYGYSSEVRANDYRSGFNVTDQSPRDNFSGVLNSGRTGVLWGGVANLSTLLGTHTRIWSNNIYNRSGDNEARWERGLSDDLGEIDIERLRYVERAVRSNQIAAEHQLATGHALDWSVTSSGVVRREPDRSEIVYGVTRDAQGNVVDRQWYRVGTEIAVRTFGDLAERNLEGAFNYRFSFGSDNVLKFGGTLRSTEREADSRSYAINNVAGQALTGEEAALTPEQIFDGRFTGEGDRYLRVIPLLQGGSYQADDRLSAGYAMLEYRLGRVQLVGGARVERWQLDVSSVCQDGSAGNATRQLTDLLPSIAANVELSEGHQLRLSAARTVARPEYRELVPCLVREVLGGDNFQGYSDLRRTAIQNFDLRYEWYPGSGEVLSFGLFAKRFDNPIERVYLPVSGTGIISVRNPESAVNYGVELEARKSLGMLGAALEPVTAFTNLTLMHSAVTLGDTTLLQNDDRALVGQAPYVLNAGLTWAHADGATSATLLYNTVGARIYAAAARGLPEVEEQPRHQLDAALRLGVTSMLSARFDVKNILDSGFQVRQGPVVRESYDSGRTYSLGLTWRQ